MSDNITLTELLYNINNNIEFCFNEELIEIDKDEYILSFKDCFNLIDIDFNFNTINFNIKINKLSEYTKLLYFNLDIINQKLENYNINDLEIDYIEYYEDEDLSYNKHKKRVLNIIKHLENKNFNFELLKLSNILDISEYCLQYLIDNNLYNFLNKDKYQIIKDCDEVNFKFFISYLNFNVYDDYDGNTFYKFIFAENRIFYSPRKFYILYKHCNLLMNDKDISICIKPAYYDIIRFYTIEEISKFNQQSLNTIFINDNHTYLFYLKNKRVEKHNHVLNLIEKLDIEFLIRMFQNHTSIEITADLFVKIINKINMNIKDILDTLKIKLKLINLLIFYHLYYQYYDIHIINYKNDIFSDEDIKILKGDMIKMYNIIKYHFEE